MNKIIRCKKTNNFILYPCEDRGCDWFIKKKSFCNCSIVAENYGPFNLEEVGKMMGVTHEWVRQIEKEALKKLKELLIKDREETD